MTSTDTLHVYGKIGRHAHSVAGELRRIADLLDEGGSEALKATALELSPTYDDHAVPIAGGYGEGGFWQVGQEVNLDGSPKILTEVEA
jgi:hypothetical protein